MLDPQQIEEERYYQVSELIPASPISFHSDQMKGYWLFSDQIKSLFNRLRKMASSPDIPLLIKGHTGSGKEVVARFMHHEVDQNQGRFIAINCTNMNRELFESQLFGYSGGAFTGAQKSGHQGYIKQAGSGTLFLDEISEIDPELQAKLLRVIEQGEYFPLGSNQKETVRARMIFASNNDLEKMMENGRLREDLYYRLNVVAVEMPGLKDRREEIIPLVALFIDHYNREFQKQIHYVQGKVLRFFYAYNWPGNIRELKNFITQMMIFIEGDTLRFEHLHIKDEMERQQTQSFSQQLSGKEQSKQDIIDALIEEPFDLEAFTSEVVRRTLKKFGGNKSKTARFLGIKREQLYHRYRIDK